MNRIDRAITASVDNKKQPKKKSRPEEQPDLVQQETPDIEQSSSSSNIDTKQSNEEKISAKQQPAFSAMKPKEIREVQEKLKRLRLFNSAADGIWGPATTAAVINFQGQNELPDTGNWDDITSQKADELIAGLDTIAEPTETTTTHYWLLKLRTNTWQPQSLKTGDKTFFNTHFFGDPRPEFSLFSNIRKGDKVLGLGTDLFEGIVCIMEVTGPVGPLMPRKFSPSGDTKQGEGFNMSVTKKFDPVIPFGKFKNLIGDIIPKLQETKKPPELFFQLSESIYNEILKTETAGDPVTFTHPYQPFFLSEGKNKDDKLDFQNDINSFATVIALKKVDPPLAIGLFGNWGSGKSFFMERLYEEIEKIVDRNEPDNIGSVVQVKFNSWHYSDTNLWASLTTQIFESLHDYTTKKEFGADAVKKIYKDLSITSQQLEETQKKLDANTAQAEILEQQKSNVEEDIRKKKERLDMWNVQGIAGVVFSDSIIQQDFENVKKQFEEEKLIDNIHQVDEKLAEVDSIRGKLVESFKLFKENSKGKWIWVWISALVIAVVIWLVLGPLKNTIGNIINEGIAATVVVLGYLVTLTAKLSPYFNKISQFYKRLKSLKQTIEKEKENVRLKEHDEVDRLNNEINELAATKTKLELQQKETTEKKEKLENEIKEIGSGKLLASFLAGRSTDDAYLKQLGIISWIRKDFAKLNELFKKQKEVQVNDAGLTVDVQIDRIVLYIDDLDRCNEEVVVKVLEAIHLLLAFPLFVVIVGVDPRWLNNALSEKFKKLFGNRSPQQKTNGEQQEPLEATSESLSLTDVATSYDYLEKIFQVPFALKPITKTGREDLIKHIIRDEMLKETISTEEGSKDHGDNKDEKSQQGGKQQQNHETPQNKKQEGEVDKSKQENQGEEVNQGEGNDRKDSKKAKGLLVFTSAELVYMQKISALFGQTPRTINRFVNIYRIIKAHDSLKVVGDYSKEEFMPIMFILGVVIGHSAFAEEFAEAVVNANDTDSFKTFVDESKLPEKLKTNILALSSDINGILMADMKRNIGLITRFSFRILLKSI